LGFFSVQRASNMSKNKRVKPHSGQESVWDYPRPPRLEELRGSIQIECNGTTIMHTTTSLRFLETSHPPTYYLPREHFSGVQLKLNTSSSFCEFKGKASYYDFVVNDKVIESAGWAYPQASGAYAQIRNCIAVYAHKMDACYVNGELVQPQEGDFYGGWITPNIVGPFKGGTGTWGW
jgi:uncharacterized protein (DUF427 family)